MPEICTDDGVRLHYRDEDYRDPWLDESDTAVLLHHGFVKSLEHWTGIVATVARHHRVIRFDVRGAGGSSAPGGGSEWSVDRLVEDAMELIDALKIARVHWAGFESGGIVGFHFAAKYPDRTASVACINMPYRGSASKDKMKAHFCRGYASPSDAIDNLGFASWISGLCEDGVLVDCLDNDVVAWVRQQAMRVTAGVAKEWHRVFWEMSDPFADIEKITVPVLLVAGAMHTFGCEPPLLDALRKRLRQGREVVYIPDVAIGVHLLAADACADAYLKFLNEVGHQTTSGSQP